MGFLAIAAIGIPELMFQWQWRLIALVVFLLGVGCLIWQGIISTSEEKEREKQQQERDKRFEELVSVRPANSPQRASERSELRHKIICLGHDLFAFLREKGPDSDISMKDSESTVEYLGRVSELRGPRVEGIHFGYQHRFRQRTIDLFNELAEHGIKDAEIQVWEVDPPQVQNEDRIRKIAERLFLLAAKMDIAEASEGT